MATATKAAAEKAENAVAQVTETVSSTVSKATAVANDLVTRPPTPSRRSSSPPRRRPRS